MDAKLKTLEGVEIENVTNEQLSEFVKRNNIDVTACKSRDDVIAAIELHNEALKPPAPPRSKRGKREPAAGAELSGVQVGAVQKVWAQFARAIPFAAHSKGVHEVEPGKREDGEDHGVPDGNYRVVGADWLLTFEGGRFVGAANAVDVKPEDYREVPQAPAIG